ncbi:hypothetical protein DEU42_11120 [Flavobacterium sp. AG291]|nr:hypothetical protein DEU42_11120 [Flavobacterium sp. AG291]
MESFFITPGILMTRINNINQTTNENNAKTAVLFIFKPLLNCFLIFAQQYIRQYLTNHIQIYCSKSYYEL